MKMKRLMEEKFSSLASKGSRAAGSFWSFTIALAIILMWGAVGPIFGFSDTWQLVINTGTTIITFLVVFLIQHSQNKEMKAIQMKLNELIAAGQGASNRLIDVEDLSDHDLQHLYLQYRKLAKTAKNQDPGTKTSIEKQTKEKFKARHEK